MSCYITIIIEMNELLYSRSGMFCENFSFANFAREFRLAKLKSHHIYYAKLNAENNVGVVTCVPRNFNLTPPYQFY